jgi:hypothetical protein
MVKLLVGFAAFAFLACSKSNSPLVIYTPCSTFCGSSSPERTPALIKSGGQLLLRVGFTPEDYKEAHAIYDAVKRRPTRLRVQRTAREFIATSVCNGCIQIPVSSAAEAEDILLDLCFRPDESKLTPP